MRKEVLGRESLFSSPGIRCVQWDGNHVGDGREIEDTPRAAPTERPDLTSMEADCMPVLHPSSQYFVKRLWSCCKFLRDDGVAPTEYLEQLALLLFLKMAHEHGIQARDGVSTQSLDSVWGSLCSYPPEHALGQC